MKIVTIVGARPQFVKAAPVSRVLRRDHEEILVHTGQHYDTMMSDVFFEELDIPPPRYNLQVGSGLHGAQTGAMLERVEAVLLDERPDWVLIYGDTNSTVAGALAAAKLHIPVAHVEAGLRSYNRSMPEELNRIVADHLSTLLLCPSETAVGNLAREGITAGVSVTGDVMADALQFAAGRARERSTILRALALRPREFILATLHRAENTDDPERLRAIAAALHAIDEPIVLPVHPRTRKVLRDNGVALDSRASVRLIEPLSYFDMVALTESARLVMTDSGGLQKEAYWLGVPCVTLRDETEWIETVQAGWNTLAGADTEAIVRTVRTLKPPAARPPLYGDGRAAARVCAALAAASAPARLPVTAS